MICTAVLRWTRIRVTRISYGTLEQNKLGDVAQKMCKKLKGPILKALRQLIKLIDFYTVTKSFRKMFFI